jgi:predicted DCC family thiol-disulfide oxidoreductase YuxK
MPHDPILLYDGSCGFCQRSVQWVLRRDQRKTLRFAPLQGAVGSAIRSRHPVLEHTDSVVWVGDPGGPDERVLIKADAGAAVLEYLGGGYQWFTALWIAPRVIRDWVYDMVARHRHRVPLPPDACLIPTTEQRQRFLE